MITLPADSGVSAGFLKPEFGCPGGATKWNHIIECLKIRFGLKQERRNEKEVIQ